MLSRQISNTACIQGSTWNYDFNRRVIWVNGGCRAEFAVNSGFAGGPPPFGAPQGANVRCESQDNRYRECQVGARGNVVLSRQLSDRACVQGRTWNYDQGRRVIWVNQGCRADFTVETGFGGGRGGFGGGRGNAGPGEPALFLNNQGNGRAVIGNCTVNYVRYSRTEASPTCEANQIFRADQAVSAYGRERGL
jgi:hypothetical protein